VKKEGGLLQGGKKEEEGYRGGERKMRSLPLSHTQTQDTLSVGVDLPPPRKGKEVRPKKKGTGEDLASHSNAGEKELLEHRPLRP